MQYNNDYVDEQYSAILEPNLFEDTVLFPGLTYNSRIADGEVTSGLVHIYKETMTAQADPGASAGDFSHADTANTLIDLRLNNGYRKSKKIYKVTVNSCSYAKAEENLSLAIKENARDRQASALACLINEGTEVSDVELLTTNINNKIVATRKTLRKLHAKPGVVLANVDTFGLMLEIAGDKYTPSTNERIVSSGQVGNYLNMTWYECDALEGSAKYYDHAGDLQTVSLAGAEFIMYDYTTFHMNDNLNMMGLVNAQPDFTGVYAQNEINTGFRVTNADKVAVYKVASSL